MFLHADSTTHNYLLQFQLHYSNTFWIFFVIIETEIYTNEPVKRNIHMLSPVNANGFLDDKVSIEGVSLGLWDFNGLFLFCSKTISKIFGGFCFFKDYIYLLSFTKWNFEIYQVVVITELERFAQAKTLT